MLLFEKILEQALAQVFEEQPVDVDITYAEISAAWARLGLRKSDLHEVIRGMVDRECLVARNLSGSLGFVLTEYGAQLFNSSRQQQEELQAWLRQRSKIPRQGDELDSADDASQPCVLH